MRSGENKGMRSRLAFLGTLAGGLAHEIKNPLSAMSVNLQMLREDLEAGETPRQQRILKRVGVLSGRSRASSRSSTASCASRAATSSSRSRSR